MGNIFTNQQSNSVHINPGQVTSDLSKLEKDLIARRGAATEQGEIAMLEEAITQVKAAQEVASEQITNSRIAAGIERDHVPAKAHIPGRALAKGEKFESYNGHGNSYMDYMKSNIAGLEMLMKK